MDVELQYNVEIMRYNNFMKTKYIYELSSEAITYCKFCLYGCFIIA